ncbi:monooxygenase 3-like [Corylus avellana]|uniref:monooxygenase 3-like n=1 Tax=Corylus avellana TaxID=13451 RepID=UPI00286AE76D|nr:monooxygenase 3-like [Corylus avellana]
MQEDQDVVIVGAGIAGLATAVALKKVGIRALVLEKSQGLRATGATLSLYPNGWASLDALGISHKLKSFYSPCTRAYITDTDTGATQEISFTKANRSGAELRVVHRKALLEALAEELPMETIRFSSNLTSITTQTQEGSSPHVALIKMEDGTTINAKALIGCDGVNSKVAAQCLGLTAPVNSGRWAVRGLAMFPHGHGLNQDFKQFVSVGKRAGFVSLNQTELYWFLTAKLASWTDKSITRDPNKIQREVIDNFATDLPPLFTEIVQHSDLSTITWAPLMYRLPWHVIFGNLCKGNITVAGDAMHPMTPDLGQNECAALEEALVLGQQLGGLITQKTGLVPAAVARAFERYAKKRRWRAAGLITTSYLSGWVQLGGFGWHMKFLRDVVFYKLLYSRVLDVIIHYDCGELPCVTSCNGCEKSD